MNNGYMFLYRFASLNQTSKYRYYIFIDDDLVLENNHAIKDVLKKNFDETGKHILSDQTLNPWIKFETFLLYYEPAIGICEGLNNIKHLLQKREIVPAYVFPGMVIDAMFNAFHHKVVNDLLPYDEGHDKLSWWGSQQFMQCKMFFRYHAHAVTFINVLVKNTLHREYPRNNLLSIEQSCREEMLLIPSFMKNSNLTQIWIKKKLFLSLNYFPYVAPPKLPIEKYKYFVDDYCSNKCAL